MQNLATTLPPAKRLNIFNRALVCPESNNALQQERFLIGGDYAIIERAKDGGFEVTLRLSGASRRDECYTFDGDGAVKCVRAWRYEKISGMDMPFSDLPRVGAADQITLALTEENRRPLPKYSGT